VKSIHADSAVFNPSVENQPMLLAHAEEFERPFGEGIKPVNLQTTRTGKDLADLLAPFSTHPAILVQYIWRP
jgi:hypothetical protein